MKKPDSPASYFRVGTVLALARALLVRTLARLLRWHGPCYRDLARDLLVRESMPTSGAGWHGDCRGGRHRRGRLGGCPLYILLDICTYTAYNEGIETEGLKMVTYSVEYQLGTGPVGRWHRSLKAAYRDLHECERAAKRGGDCQDIWLVSSDDSEVPSE